MFCIWIKIYQFHHGDTVSLFKNEKLVMHLFLAFHSNMCLELYEIKCAAFLLMFLPSNDDAKSKAPESMLCCTQRFQEK